MGPSVGRWPVKESKVPMIGLKPVCTMIQRIARQERSAQKLTVRRCIASNPLRKRFRSSSIRTVGDVHRLEVASINFSGRPSFARAISLASRNQIDGRGGDDVPIFVTEFGSYKEVSRFDRESLFEVEIVARID